MQVNNADQINLQSKQTSILNKAYINEDEICFNININNIKNENNYFKSIKVDLENINRINTIHNNKNNNNCNIENIVKEIDLLILNIKNCLILNQSDHLINNVLSDIVFNSLVLNINYLSSIFEHFPLNAFIDLSFYIFFSIYKLFGVSGCLKYFNILYNSKQSLGLLKLCKHAIKKKSNVSKNLNYILFFNFINPLNKQFILDNSKEIEELINLCFTFYNRFNYSYLTFYSLYNYMYKYFSKNDALSTEIKIWLELDTSGAILKYLFDYIKDTSENKLNVVFITKIITESIFRCCIVLGSKLDIKINPKIIFANFCLKLRSNFEIYSKNKDSSNLDQLFKKLMISSEGFKSVVNINLMNLINNTEMHFIKEEKVDYLMFENFLLLSANDKNVMDNFYDFDFYSNESNFNIINSIISYNKYEINDSKKQCKSSIKCNEKNIMTNTYDNISDKNLNNNISDNLLNKINNYFKEESIFLTITNINKNNINNTDILIDDIYSKNISNNIELLNNFKFNFLFANLTDNESNNRSMYINSLYKEESIKNNSHEKLTNVFDFNVIYNSIIISLNSNNSIVKDYKSNKIDSNIEMIYLITGFIEHLNSKISMLKNFVKQDNLISKRKLIYNSSIVFLLKNISFFVKHIELFNNYIDYVMPVIINYISCFVCVNSCYSKICLILISIILFKIKKYISNFIDSRCYNKLVEFFYCIIVSTELRYRNTINLIDFYNISNTKHKNYMFMSFLNQCSSITDLIYEEYLNINVLKTSIYYFCLVKDSIISLSKVNSFKTLETFNLYNKEINCLNNSGKENIELLRNDFDCLLSRIDYKFNFINKEEKILSIKVIDFILNKLSNYFIYRQDTKIISLIKSIIKKARLYYINFNNEQLVSIGICKANLEQLIVEICCKYNIVDGLDIDNEELLLNINSNKFVNIYDVHCKVDKLNFKNIKIKTNFQIIILSDIINYYTYSIDFNIIDFFNILAYSNFNNIKNNIDNIIRSKIIEITDTYNTQNNLEKETLVNIEDIHNYIKLKYLKLYNYTVKDLLQQISTNISHSNNIRYVFKILFFCIYSSNIHTIDKKEDLFKLIDYKSIKLRDNMNNEYDYYYNQENYSKYLYYNDFESKLYYNLFSLVNILNCPLLKQSYFLLSNRVFFNFIMLNVLVISFNSYIIDLNLYYSCNNSCLKIIGTKDKKSTNKNLLIDLQYYKKNNNEIEFIKYYKIITCYIDEIIKLSIISKNIGLCLVITKFINTINYILEHNCKKIYLTYLDKSTDTIGIIKSSDNICKIFEFNDKHEPVINKYIINNINKFNLSEYVFNIKIKFEAIYTIYNKYYYMIKLAFCLYSSGIYKHNMYFLEILINYYLFKHEVHSTSNLIDEHRTYYITFLYLYYKNLTNNNVSYKYEGYLNNFYNKKEIVEKEYSINFKEILKYCLKRENFLEYIEINCLINYNFLNYFNIHVNLLSKLKELFTFSISTIDTTDKNKNFNTDINYEVRCFDLLNIENYTLYPYNRTKVENIKKFYLNVDIKFLLSFMNSINTFKFYNDFELYINKLSNWSNIINILDNNNSINSGYKLNSISTKEKINNVNNSYSEIINEKFYYNKLGELYVIELLDKQTNNLDPIYITLSYLFYSINNCYLFKHEIIRIFEDIFTNKLIIKLYLDNYYLYIAFLRNSIKRIYTCISLVYSRDNNIMVQEKQTLIILLLNNLDYYCNSINIVYNKLQTILDKEYLRNNKCVLNNYNELINELQDNIINYVNTNSNFLNIENYYNFIIKRVLFSSLNLKYLEIEYLIKLIEIHLNNNYNIETSYRLLFKLFFDFDTFITLQANNILINNFKKLKIGINKYLNNIEELINFSYLEACKIIRLLINYYLSNQTKSKFDYKELKTQILYLSDKIINMNNNLQTNNNNSNNNNNGKYIDKLYLEANKELNLLLKIHDYYYCVYIDNVIDSHDLYSSIFNYLLDYKNSKVNTMLKNYNFDIVFNTIVFTIKHPDYSNNTFIKTIHYFYNFKFKQENLFKLFLIYTIEYIDKCNDLKIISNLISSLIYIIIRFKIDIDSKPEEYIDIQLPVEDICKYIFKLKYIHFLKYYAIKDILIKYYLNINSKINLENVFNNKTYNNKLTIIITITLFAMIYKLIVETNLPEQTVYIYHTNSININDFKKTMHLINYLINNSVFKLENELIEEFKKLKQIYDQNNKKLDIIINSSKIIKSISKFKIVTRDSGNYSTIIKTNYDINIKKIKEINEECKIYINKGYLVVVPSLKYLDILEYTNCFDLEENLLFDSLVDKFNFLIEKNIYKTKLYYFNNISNNPEDLKINSSGVNMPIEIKIESINTAYNRNKNFTYFFKNDQFYLSEIEGMNFFLLIKQLIMINDYSKNTNKEKHNLKYNLINKDRKVEFEESLKNLYQITKIETNKILVEKVENLSHLESTVKHLLDINGVNNAFNSHKENIFKEELFNSIYKRRVLYKYFFKFDKADNWFNSKMNYTYSCSIWSILGCIIGLGDRHLQNILISSDGSINHVDYGMIDNYSSLLPVPEKVPFRFTINIFCALGINEECGPFLYYMDYLINIIKKDIHTICMVKDTMSNSITLGNFINNFENNNSIDYFIKLINTSKNINIIRKMYKGWNGLL